MSKHIPLTLFAIVSIIQNGVFAQDGIEQITQRTPVQKSTTERSSIPYLTGEELLCEIETASFSGIFAVDTKKQLPLPIPVVENASSPKWAPKHTVFSFFKGGAIWVGDRTGRTQPICLIPRNAENFTFNWDNSGRPYAIYTVSGWTQIFARGINVNEELAATRLKEKKNINLKFSEKIIMKADRFLPEERSVEVETQFQGKQLKEKVSLSPQVKSTSSVAFSPDNQRFIMQVGDGLPDSAKGKSHLWLFKTIDFNVNSPGYSREAYDKVIAANDYSRFYLEHTLMPNATFLKELTGQRKDVFEMHPVWSPDGKMIAFTQLNPTSEEVWPHILSGNNFEQNTVVKIPNYLPSTPERWAKKSVEVLSWESDGTLFLIEGTRDKIYQVKQTPNGFEASILVEINASGRPTILYPAFHKDWLAYALSIDNYSAVHLKNYKTGEERLLKLAISGKADGVIKALNW